MRSISSFSDPFGFAFYPVVKWQQLQLQMALYCRNLCGLLDKTNYFTDLMFTDSSLFK